MNLCAMLPRHKGRVIYNAMFLLAQTQPDDSFLSERHCIHNLDELKAVTAEMLKVVNLNLKRETLST